jgi:Trypsin-co-occurring domain 2
VSRRDLLAAVKRLLRARVPLYAVFIIVVFALLPQTLWHLNKQAMRRAPLGTEKGLELQELIVKVKSELVQAERQLIKAGEAPLLALKDVELEINFVVHTKAGAEAELVAVSGGMEVGQEKTQRIRISLTPIAKDLQVQPRPKPLMNGERETVIGPTPPPKKKENP